jgi:hypothetical protein
VRSIAIDHDGISALAVFHGTVDIGSNRISTAQGAPTASCGTPRPAT